MKVVTVHTVAVEYPPSTHKGTPGDKKKKKIFALPELWHCLVVDGYS